MFYGFKYNINPLYKSWSNDDYKLNQYQMGIIVYYE